MKKLQLLLLFLFSTSLLFAQWTQINNGLSSHAPTSMYTMTGFDAVWIGNAGMAGLNDTGKPCKKSAKNVYDNFVKANVNSGKSCRFFV